MFATRRTQVLRTTLTVAALAAAFVASSAHAGLLGGGGGGLTGGLTGGLNGALSPRQLDVGGRANGTANADGSLIKGTVDKTKGAVGAVKDTATAKAGELKTAGDSVKDSLGQASGSADGSLSGALKQGDTPAATTPAAPATPTATAPTTATAPAKPAAPLAPGGNASGRKVQVDGSSAAKASRTDNGVALNAAADGSAKR